MKQQEKRVLPIVTERKNILMGLALMKREQLARPEKMSGKKSMIAQKRILLGGVAVSAMLILLVGCASKNRYLPIWNLSITTCNSRPHKEKRKMNYCNAIQDPTCES